MKIYAFKQQDCLAPCSPADAEIIEQLAFGEAVQVEIKRPRNLRFHRKYFALMKTLYDIEGIQKHFTSIEHMRIILQMAVGHFEAYVTPEGRTVYTPKSISFASMDDIEFNEMYNKIIQYVIEKFVPEYTPEDIDNIVYKLGDY